MTRSDFTWVNFDEKFCMNSPEATRTFNIDGNPNGVGFLLVQFSNVKTNDHRILINDQDILVSFDIPAHKNANENWYTWMDRIPPGFLHQGENRITVRWSSAGKIGITNIAIHWRETGRIKPASVLNLLC